METYSKLVEFAVGQGSFDGITILELDRLSTCHLDVTTLKGITLLFLSNRR